MLGSELRTESLTHLDRRSGRLGHVERAPAAESRDGRQPWGQEEPQVPSAAVVVVLVETAMGW